MKTHHHPILVPVILLALSLGCAKESTKPQGVRPDPVTVHGVIETPWEAGALSPGDVEVTFADQVVPVAEDGTFEITAYPDGPGLLLATDGVGNAVLMSVVSGIADGATVRLDAHSTALALAFFFPGITTSDPTEAAAVLAEMEGFDAFLEFRGLLTEKLAEDPAALSAEDEELSMAWQNAIEAYFERMLDASKSETATVPDMAPQGEIVVDPSYEKGGHRINHLGGTRFEVTNACGRWALFVPPEDDDGFWIFPNGDLIDAIRKGRPFPPSKRAFDLQVALDDDETVEIFGMGLSPDVDNVWEDLDPAEQTLAIQAGVATSLLEYVPHLLSTVGNTGRVVESLKSDDLLFKTVSLIMKNTRIIDRVREYIRAGDIGGMYWFLTKSIVSEAANNPEFRASIAGLLGMAITDSMVTRVVAVVNTWVIQPLLLGNSYTSVLKTVLGLGSSRYKTTFTISNLVSDFGNIAGSVHDKTSGLPIEGATVELLGEVENPLNPDLTDVTTASGAYFFENITTGLKSVRASMNGYLPTTVNVTVRKNETVTAPLITLARPSGSAFGTIRNRILTDHGIANDRFQGSVTLEAREIGGGTHASFSLTGGDYEVGLPPGTFWLVARHEDYFPDSVQVTVHDGTRTAAGRDLVMAPRGRLEGEVLIDMDNNGQFETRFDIAGGTATIVDPQLTGGLSLMVTGGTGGISVYDSFTLLFDLSAVTGLGAYNLGGMDDIGDGSVAAAALYVTTRFTCQPPSGPAQPITFATRDYSSNSDQTVCECGVGFKGTVIVDEWGSALTEAVDAEIFGGELVGYRNCGCTCCADTDGDGQVDDYVAQCARARLNLRFRGLVGSLAQGGP